MKTIKILMSVMITILAGCAQQKESERADSTLHGLDLIWTNPIWRAEPNETNAPEQNGHIIEFTDSVEPMDHEMTEEKDRVSRMGLIYDVQK